MRLIRARGGGLRRRKRGLGTDDADCDLHRWGRRTGPQRGHPRRRAVRPSSWLAVLRHPARLRGPALLQRRRSAGAGRSSRHHPPGRHHPRHHQPRQSLPLSAGTSTATRWRSTGRTIWWPPSRPAASTPSSPSAATAAFRSPTSSGAGLPVVCVPKTIDNDVGGTQRTFGFEAPSTATEALDKVHSTAESHDRVMVVEPDGPLRRLDRPLQRPLGQRRRDPDPEILRHREGVREDPARGKRRPALQHRGGGRGCPAQRRRHRAGRAPRVGTCRSARRDRQQGGEAIEPVPARRPAPRAGAPAARRLAHDLRPAARAPIRRSRGARDRRRSAFGTMVGLNGPDIRWVPLAECVARSRTCRSMGTSSPRRASWGSAWETDPRCLPILYPAPRMRSRSCTERPFPIPTDGWRTGRAPTPGQWTDVERAQRSHWTPSPRGSRSALCLDRPLAIGALGVPTPARGRYFYQRRDGRQNQPVLYLRGIRAATAPSTSTTRWTPAAPWRSTGTIPATTAGSSPTACPRTAASRACCR